MDERRVVEILRKLRSQMFYVTADEAAALDHAIATIERERWIPCSERLPERDGLGEVLAFNAGRPNKPVWLETTHPSWWGQFMEGANEWGPTITHWRQAPERPLPDPQPDGQEG